jgi:hypothetical protein
VLGSQRLHGFEFLRCGGYGGLDCGDVAEPALFFGFLQPIEEIGVDPLQPRRLSWVDPK